MFTSHFTLRFDQYFHSAHVSRQAGIIHLPSSSQHRKQGTAKTTQRENGMKKHNSRDTASNLRVLAEQSPSEAGRVLRERATYTHLGSWIATKLTDATDPTHLVSSRVTTCPLAMSHIILLFYLRAWAACLPFTLTNTTKQGLWHRRQQFRATRPPLLLSMAL